MLSTRSVQAAVGQLAQKTRYALQGTLLKVPHLAYHFSTSKGSIGSGTSSTQRHSSLKITSSEQNVHLDFNKKNCSSIYSYHTPQILSKPCHPSFNPTTLSQARFFFPSVHIYKNPPLTDFLSIRARSTPETKRLSLLIPAIEAQFLIHR